jgi:hypothetical protein
MFQSRLGFRKASIIIFWTMSKSRLLVRHSIVRENSALKKRLRGEINMHYTLLFYETPEDFSHRTDPLHQQEYLAGWSHYVDALRGSGIVVSSSGLYPPDTATTLRRQGGEMLVQDGPITETKEQLGGFFIIDVPDLDTALEWAARCPIDAVEIRQNIPPMK